MQISHIARGLLASAALFGASLAVVAVPVPASAASVMSTPGAQWPADQDEATDWLTDMPSPVFIAFALAIVDKPSVINTDYDYVINPSRHRLISIECKYHDGRHWSIVGEKPYNGNPKEVQARSVTKVNLHGFNEWCDSFVGISETGETLIGTLNVPGDSVKSFAIIFDTAKH